MAEMQVLTNLFFLGPPAVGPWDRILALGILKKAMTATYRLEHKNLLHPALAPFPHPTKWTAM